MVAVLSEARPTLASHGPHLRLHVFRSSTSLSSPFAILAKSQIPLGFHSQSQYQLSLNNSHCYWRLPVKLSLSLSLSPTSQRNAPNQIVEILESICSHLGSKKLEYLSVPQDGAFSALPAACQTFHEPALNVLWYLLHIYAAYAG
jgi:hypothetical protein